MTTFDPQRILSRRTSAVKEAAIIRMAQKARELKAAGQDVVSLTLGEPDFDTPQFIRAAAEKAMNDGFTHYAPIPGMPQLRKALSDKFARENGLTYDWSEIVLSNGAKQSITNAIFATIDEGDEVILLAPYWVAYEGVIRMAGGVPVIVHAGPDQGFKPTAREIGKAFSDKTKLLIINSPNNPTGAMFTRQELAEIADVVTSHPSVMVISDEIYEYIHFESEHVSIGTFNGMAERTITVNGFSKGFAMTGWRLGYAGAPAPIAKAMSKVQGTFTAGCNAFVQVAAIAALEGPRDEVENMRQTYQTRRDLMVDGLAAIPGLEIHKPAGTFYAFPDISAFLNTNLHGNRFETVDALCDWLLEKHLVATVPGSAFGEPNALRLSFATDEKTIEQALTRLSHAFSD